MSRVENPRVKNPIASNLMYCEKWILPFARIMRRHAYKKDPPWCVRFASSIEIMNYVYDARFSLQITTSVFIHSYILIILHFLFLVCSTLFALCIILWLHSWSRWAFVIMTTTYTWLNPTLVYVLVKENHQNLLWLLSIIPAIIRQ